MEPLYIQKKVRVQRDVAVVLPRAMPNTHIKINVSVGDRVSPENILCEGETLTGFITVHLNNAKLKRKIGQTIYQGELLAEEEGLLGLNKKMILSPSDGILDSYEQKNGELKINNLPQKTKLISGVDGVVDKIDDKKGIFYLKTRVNLIHGVIGSGGVRDGTIRILSSAESLISAKQILPDFKRQILIGGGLIFKDALIKALTVGVAGVVSGGVNAIDFKALVGGDWSINNKIFADVGISVMICEGFGSAAIGEDIFTLLSKYQGKFGIINGNKSLLILPISNSNSMIKVQNPRDEEDEGQVRLVEGILVRVISSRMLGTQGIVLSIDKTPTRLPSGISANIVTVKTITGKLRVPYINLEAI